MKYVSESLVVLLKGLPELVPLHYLLYVVHVTHHFRTLEVDCLIEGDVFVEVIVDGGKAAVEELEVFGSECLADGVDVGKDPLAIDVDQPADVDRVVPPLGTTALYGQTLLLVGKNEVDCVKHTTIVHLYHLHCVLSQSCRVSRVFPLLSIVNRQLLVRSEVIRHVDLLHYAESLWNRYRVRL